MSRVRRRDRDAPAVAPPALPKPFDEYDDEVLRDLPDLAVAARDEVHGDEETDSDSSSDSLSEDPYQHTVESIAFAVFVVVFELIMMILFFACAVNGQDEFIHNIHVNDTTTTAGDDPAFAQYYHMFIEVGLMIFVAFGLLLSFLKKHGVYALGMAFLVACLCAQLTIFVMGYGHILAQAILKEATHWYVVVDLPAMIVSLFGAATVLISAGVILGLVTPMQLCLIMMIEIPIWVLNAVIVENLLGVYDVGGSMVVHAFGGYFGVWLGFVYRNAKVNAEEVPEESSTVISDYLSLLGTCLLWVLWPSFNGALETEFQHRVAINTFLSLLAGCITSFVLSRIVRKRFGMADIQNATLAAGVAIGASANLPVPPGLATLIGILGGALSTVGYAFIQPFLFRTIGFHDSCGVHNLHAMPGLLGGFASIFATILLGESATKGHLQPLYQLAGLAVTLLVASLGGAATGLIVRLCACCHPQEDDLFDEEGFFEVEYPVEKKED